MYIGAPLSEVEALQIEITEQRKNEARARAIRDFADGKAKKQSEEATQRIEEAFDKILKEQERAPDETESEQQEELKAFAAAFFGGRKPETGKEG